MILQVGCSVVVKGFRGSGLESLDQVPGLCKESARVYEDPTTLLGGGGVSTRKIGLMSCHGGWAGFGLLSGIWSGFVVLWGVCAACI